MPIFDDQAVASIGAVAINQQNPDIIWVGTGEGNVRNSTSVGGGVYKSIDGGKSFTYLGLEKTERIHRIALHPTNPDIAYIAALGSLWGENAERGIYKTTDGGKSWQKILYIDQKTGATDIRMVPGNPDKLIAGMWQFRRWPYFFKSGGAGSGIYISHDGGLNWEQRTQEDGLPDGELGRSAFAISPSDPQRIYALVEAEKSALARSDDGGRSWALVNQDFDIADRPFYYNDIAVDPVDKNRVYRIGSRVKLSIDGGKTFDFIESIDCCATANTLHIDTHAWWINPRDPRHMIDGNDGGIGITRDQGKTWRFVRNLPLAQFYHIAVDNDTPYNIYGGLQDNGSWRGPSEVWENGGIRNFHWQEVSFGDGFDTVPDPTNSSRGYSMSQGGTLYRWNLETGEVRLIQPAAPDLETELRFNWNAGFAIDPFKSEAIYLGSQYLHKSTDRGLTWEVISGDLTTNNAAVQTFRESGGLTRDVTAAENYTTITMVAPSPIEEGTIWVGTDDGRVHVTRDGGANWHSLEGRAGAAKGGWVTMIDPSPHDAGTAFITIDDHRRGNKAPYVFRMSNYGQNWRSLSTNQISGYALSVKQDPVDPNLLFLGTEFGLHVSFDGGRSWSKWTAGLPTIAVSDIAIQTRESDLIVATHGRAAFVIDDYSALRGINANALEQRFAILGVTNGQQYRARQSASTRFPGNGEFRADNEPYGAMVTFVATGSDLPHPDEKTERDRLIAERRQASKSEPAEDNAEDEGAKKGSELTIKILDQAGETIRTFKHDVYQGINRVVWNLREDGLAPVPPGEPNEDGTLPPGQEALPGNYTAQLIFEGETREVAFTVLSDPRREGNDDEQKAAYDALKTAIALEEKAGDAVRTIIEARRDVDTVTEMIVSLKQVRNIMPDDQEHPLSKLEKQAGDVIKALNEVEAKFRVAPETKGIVFDNDKVFSRIGAAQFHLGSTYDVPTAAGLKSIDHARNALDQAVNELNSLLGGEFAAFRKAVEDANLNLLDQKAL